MKEMFCTEMALRVSALTALLLAAPAATSCAADVPQTKRSDRITQYGITWAFERAVTVGQFVTGDYYVVGPVTVTSIDPPPLVGRAVENGEEWTAVARTDSEGKTVKDDKGKVIYDFTDVDGTERKYFGGDNPRLDADETAALVENPHYCRNGSVLSIPPTLRQSGFDSRVRHEIYDPGLTACPPIRMVPGDSLVSTISKKRLVRDKHYSPVAAVAILTCLEAAVPADAFRPGYMAPEHTIHLARNLKRELLPTLERTESTPDIGRLAAYFDRPWLEYNLFHEDWAPHQASKGYGQGLARRGGDAALALCLDFTPEEKEPLLIGYIQFGIDLYGMLQNGCPGWQAYGGWNSGHKLPIILSGVLLGDEQMASPSKTYPEVSFQEDEQTGYGRSWRGAPVVFLGHSGVDTATGKGRVRGDKDWGPYEHKHPSEWHERNWQSEAYRRCCTSRAWIGTALAAKLMKLEPYWAHDAFFDYVDRWMTEEETDARKIMAEVEGGQTYGDWGWQGAVEVDFHEEMWLKYRATLQPAPSAWREKAPTNHPATEEE